MKTNKPTTNQSTGPNKHPFNEAGRRLLAALMSYKQGLAGVDYLLKKDIPGEVGNSWAEEAHILFQILSSPQVFSEESLKRKGSNQAEVRTRLFAMYLAKLLRQHSVGIRQPDEEKDAIESLANALTGWLGDVNSEASTVRVIERSEPLETQSGYVACFVSVPNRHVREVAEAIHQAADEVLTRYSTPSASPEDGSVQ
jgi:hypothetical protein